LFYYLFSFLLILEPSERPTFDSIESTLAQLDQSNVSSLEIANELNKKGISLPSENKSSQPGEYKSPLVHSPSQESAGSNVRLFMF